MKLLTAARRVLTRGCVFYTVLITGAYFLGVSVNAAWLPAAGTVVSLLVFSFWLGLSAEFLASDLLTGPLRVLLHFFATFFVFWLTFLRMGGYLSRGGSFGVAAAAFLFVYVLAAVLILLRRWLTEEVRTKDRPHVGLFEGNSAGKSAPDSYQPQFSGENPKEGDR